MNQKNFTNIILIILILAVIAIGGYFLFSKKSEALAETQQSNIIESNFQYDEVIKSKIGINGGLMQNADKSITVTIPPLKQEREFILSFKKSNFKVISGTRSPVTISIYPNINLMDSPTPIKIRVKYDDKIDIPTPYIPVPYFIDEKNKLDVAQLSELDQENHYFTIDTFRGGDYSWIYATEQLK